jgi:hypothetical protein
MDFRFGQIAVLVSGALGQKGSTGLPLGLGDFFPDLVQAVEEPPPNLRVLRGSDPINDTGKMAGWDRWASMCRAVQARRAG